MNAQDVPAPVLSTGLRRVADLFALTKPKLNAMAVFAVAVGWWAEAGAPATPGPLLWAIAGAGAIAFGASALNQYIERDRDAQMDRTRDRPLPAGRVTPRDALWFGTVLSVAGLAILALTSTPLAAALGLATLVTYVCIYTPLKTRTSLNTLVGTLPGALPPLIGAAAASGALSSRAWFLFALIGIWQLPHFLAIAWLYRVDYGRAGFAMLPVVTSESAATARQVLLQGLLTVIVSLTAVPFGLAGRTYFVVALVAGVLLLAAGAQFAVRRTDVSARLLLRASLVHLPLVLAAFALDPA